MRPTRFALNLPVRYREVGKIDWHIGRTEDFSRSGVFLRSGDGVDVAARVEIRVALPPVAFGAAEPAEIACSGRVVRHVSESHPWLRRGFGIELDHYEFRRGRARTPKLRLIPKRSAPLHRPRHAT